MLTGIDASELADLSRDIRRVEGDFANAMAKELRDAVTPLTALLKASAKSNLPSYIAADAASTIRQSVGFSGVAIKRTSSARFTQGGYTDAYGKVRHPLFGNRDYWYDTDISGAEGWFTRVADDNIPEATDRVITALNLIVNRIAAGNFATATVGRSTVIA